MVSTPAAGRERLISRAGAFAEMGRACLAEALEAERQHDLEHAESLRVHGLRLLIESQLLQGLPTLHGA